MISKERDLKRRGESPSSCGSFLLARFRKGTPYAIKAERKSKAEVVQARYAHMKLITAITPIHEFYFLRQANFHSY